jgi:hypothetical protein
LDEWLTRVSEAAKPEVERLFRRGHVVMVFFFASADFDNVTSGRFERGTYCVGRPFLPPFAPYKRELEELMTRIDATKTIDPAAAEDLANIDQTR